MSVEEDTDMLENCSQTQGGNKELTKSDDPLGTRDESLPKVSSCGRGFAAQWKETVSEGLNKIFNKSVKKLGNDKINTIPASRTIEKRNEVAKVEKRRPQSFELLSWEPRAFLFQDFLSEEECGHLIKLATPHLKRSQINDRITGESKVTSFRTSFGVSLKRGYDEIIRNIEKRVAETTFMPIEHGEPLHVLRYEISQKIEPHRDYFDPPNKNTANGGQRIATFLMYLSDVEEGGETIFPLAKGNITSVPWCDGPSKQLKNGVVVRPKMGDAVLFWSIKPDGTLDPFSLHGGVPVIKGNKWCCTKWMREKEYNCFLNKPELKEEKTFKNELNLLSKKEPSVAVAKESSSEKLHSTDENNVNQKDKSGSTSRKRRKVWKSHFDEKGREVCQLVWEDDEKETKDEESEETCADEKIKNVLL